MARDTITTRGMAQRADRLLRAKSLEELAFLLGTTAVKLLALGMKPTYEEFYIPKKSGGKRLIENPVPALKKVQRKLNKLLQAVYHFHRTDAAYGFLTNPVDDPSPRHILTNATRHIGCTWMLNMDMKDFFHTVTQHRVTQLFEAPLLDFPLQSAQFLAELTCYKGRLPMGAPTSPVISNLITIPLDQDLAAFAKKHNWVYTRYADDMTFSGHHPITQDHIHEITQWVEHYDFKINPSKIRLYPPESKAKEVTGLLIRANKVDVTDEYLTLLDEAISKYNDIVDAQHLTPSGRDKKSAWVEELEDQIAGRLEFVRQILGEFDPHYLNLLIRFNEAKEPPEVYGALSWLDFGYQPPK